MPYTFLYRCVAEYVSEGEKSGTGGTVKFRPATPTDGTSALQPTSQRPLMKINTGLEVPAVSLYFVASAGAHAKPCKTPF